MAVVAELNRRNIFNNIATLFSGSVVAQGMTALSILLTARQLGVEAYGQYAASMAITSVTAIVFALGLDVWLLREGGREAHRLPVTAGSVLAINSSIGLIWTVCVFWLAPLLNQETYPVLLVRLSMLLVLLDTLLGTTLTAFKAALRNRIPSILEASADIIWFIGTLLLIRMGESRPEIYLTIRVVISATALLIGLLLFRWLVGMGIERANVGTALRSSAPFAASGLLAIITWRADVVIVGLTLGKIATGLYSPAVGLVNMAFLAPLAVYMVILPVLSNLFAHHPEQARRTAARTVALSLTLGAILAVAFAIGAPLAGILLGESYRGTEVILRILSLVLFFKCGSLAMSAILIATEQQVKRTYMLGIAAAANILLNLLVVYTLGIRGVAGVYVLTEVILLAGYSWLVWRKVWQRRS